jgi:dTDP-4-amino-4,6-dideoxygalactose transaminase
VVGVQDRDRVRKHLAERGIQHGIHYPVPVHLHRAYEGLGLRKGAFPVAERLASEILSLPMFAEITVEQIDRTCDALREVLG